MRSVTIRKTVLVCSIMLFFILQNWFQQWYQPFQYADEAFAALAIPLCFLKIAQKKFQIVWTKEKILFAVFFLLFLVSGWCGFFKYHYEPFLNAAKDFYVNIKFFLAIVASYFIFADGDIDYKGMKQKVWIAANAITSILFVLCVMDLCFGIFESDMRGGLRAVKLFYSAYTVLVGCCVLLCAVYFWLLEEQKRRVLVPIAMLAFVMLSTRRVKAVGALACFLLIYLYVFRKKQRIGKKTKIFVGIALISSGIAGIYQTVSYYFLMGAESARAVLTIGAPFIAYDHFPFGTGWGTYGSTFSITPYSAVYGMYRMAGVWGLSQEYPEFVSDTFWPMILGQCGFFGFLAFLGVLILFVRKIFSLKKDKSIFASALFIVLYLLISSTSESAFANPIAVPLAFWIGILFASYKPTD